MFVVLVNYLKPIEEVERVVVPHGTYLDELYAQGVLLVSGPKIPRTGGVLLPKVWTNKSCGNVTKDPFCTQGNCRIHNDRI